MFRCYKIVLLVILCALLSGCRFGRRDNASGVYATAYVLLTQTASALPSPPLQETYPTILVQPTPLPTVTGTSLTGGQYPIPGVTAPASDSTAASAPASSVPPAGTALAPTLPGSQNPLVTQPAASPGVTATPTITPTPGFTPLPGSPAAGLVGIWQQDHSGWFAQFDADGAYRLAPSFTGLQEDLWDTGRYQLQGDQVILDSATNSPNCRGLRGVHQLQIPGEGQRRFGPIAETCFEREDVLQRGDFLWTTLTPGAQPASDDAFETAVQLIPLSGPAALPAARLVGMAWVNDFLVLLPQLPNFASTSGDGQLFALNKADITAYLSGINRTMPVPMSIELVANGALQQIPGFAGFQAMAVSADKLVLLAQGSVNGVARSYLVSGTFDLAAGRLTLDPARLVEVPAQPGSPQSTYRSILVKDNVIIVLPETLAAAVNPTPVAQLFDASLSFTGSMSLPGLDYYMTDATAPDGNGRFWGINKYTPGEPLNAPSIDPLALRYGEGLTHQMLTWVERLVLLSYSPSGISLVDEPPFQLELWVNAGRNWQAITRLDESGLLVATSQTPETLLGFIPFP